jgi:hypothetical protein
MERLVESLTTDRGVSAPQRHLDQRWTPTVSSATCANGDIRDSPWPVIPVRDEEVVGSNPAHTDQARQQVSW